MSDPRPVAPPDSQTQAFWDATRESRLVIQLCASCGHHQHYPRAVCTSCGSPDVRGVTAAGIGTLYSFTVVHRAPHPAFQPPYVVAMVRLDEGPVLLTNIEGDPAVLRCDMPVAVVWEDLPDGRKLPLFQPVRG